MNARRAVVTGASRGIGRALALELASRGAELVLVARHRDALDSVASEIRSRGGVCRVVDADVSEATGWVATLRELDRTSPIDLVIANAGVGLPSPDATPYAWESLAGAMQTNVVGASATLTALLPAMVARGAGHVVAIGSLASYGAIPGSAAYCAPKASIDMLIDCLHLDLRGTGVAATNVRLGFVDTQMTKRSRHPMPGLLGADAVARSVVARLESRPRAIVIPRALALGARAMASLPESVRELVWGEIAKRARI